MSSILLLSQLPGGIRSAEEIIDCMLDLNADTLINDVSASRMEYAIDDIIDSEEYLLLWYNKFKKEQQ
jgi:hypothetical protein